MSKIFLSALKGERTDQVPFWFMRQAGRYLPEYREIRAKARDFLDMCYSPDKAIEVTLQPIRRYGMSAAILFSDILVVPDALGQKVEFISGRGPVLEPIKNRDELKTLSIARLHDHLEPVYQTVRGLRRELPEDVALIGFAGAPWTVATYMVEGEGSKDHGAAKAFAYGDENGFNELIDLLIQSTSDYLIAQINAGAEAVQIFDSWAGSLSEREWEKWSLRPIQEIVKNIRAVHPDVPIIGFPKGVGVLYERFVIEAGVDGVSIDANVPVKWAADALQTRCCVQGNMDPRLVVAGGKSMLDEAQRILSTLKNGLHIFNLGHGFVPETPPENVAELSSFIKNWKP